MEIINLINTIDDKAMQQKKGRFSLEWSMFVKEINDKIINGIQKNPEDTRRWADLYTYLILWSKLIEIDGNILMFFKIKALKAELITVRNFIARDIIPGE